MFESFFESPPESFDRVASTESERALVDLPAEDTAGIPAGLDQMAPGVALAAVLSTVDPFAVSGYARVKVLRARERLVSHQNAEFYGALTSISDYMFELDGDIALADEAAAYEIRAALRLTRRTADNELDLAHVLSLRLPQVGEALTEGRIDVRRARVISYGTSHLDPGTARRVVDMVIDDAPRLTSGQLHARVRKLCFEADPEETKTRYQQALEERKVVKDANTSGTANLFLTNLAPDGAAEAYANIDAIAKTLTGDDDRSIDQLRADVALDLLTGQNNYKTTGKGTVNIGVDLKTLAALNDAPGDLAGYGPVIADIARQVTQQQENTEWRFVVTDPETGMVVHNGTTRRRPTAEQKRYVTARNRTCVSPGCRMPAEDSDLDHTKPWAQTHHTTVAELCPLCRHDHCQRHKHGWTYQPLPDGDYIWTSRLGHKYTTSGRPPP